MRRDKRSTREADADRNYTNRKPYRTTSQKQEARATAHRCKDGAWRSNAPVSRHSQRKRLTDGLR